MSLQRRFTPLEAKLLKLKKRRTDLDRIIRMLAQYQRNAAGPQPRSLWKSPKNAGGGYRAALLLWRQNY
jgi:hypothetical protein